ncbi:MFS transporter [Salinarimonas sp.]|uniref:MFS transporter n=1 Tax=Salinarimonas sp. TaxID=2766526 RepID=UPI00391D7693
MSAVTASAAPATMGPGRFRAFVGAKFVSDCASSMDMVILSAYVFAATGEALAVGLFLTARLAATVVGSTLASRIADRMPRRAILIAADLGRALGLFLFALAPAEWHPILFVPLAIVLGSCTGLFKVALYAEAPALRGYDQRHAVNATFNASEGVAEVVGGLSAAFVLALMSFKGVFLIDAATYLVSALALFLLMRGIGSAAPAAALARIEAKAAPPVAPVPILALIRAVSIALPITFIARGVEAFGSSAHNIGFPVFSADFDPDNPAFLFGLIMAAWGAGRLVAAGAIPRILAHPVIARDVFGLERVFLVGMILTFAMFLGVFATLVVPVVVFFAFAAGIFDASTEVAYYSSLQRAPAESRGRVIGVSYALERMAMGLGMLATSAVLQVQPLFETVAALYGVSVLIAAALLVAMARLRRPGADGAEGPSARDT